MASNVKNRFRRRLVRTRATVKGVTDLQEGPWRWAVGIQAGIAIGVPVALFTYTGHQSYGLISSLGGLIALYGVAQQTSIRLRLIPFIITGFLIAALIGTAVAGNEWLAIVALILVTIVSGVVAFGTGLGPPGPVIFILITAVSARLAAPVSMGGANVPMHIILFLIAMGAILAYICIIVLSQLPYIRKDAPDVDAPVLTAGIHLDREMKLVIIRIVAAVVIALIISEPLGIQRSYWMIVASAAILQVGRDRHLTTVRAIQRVLGTLLGVIVFEAIHYFHPQGIWVIIIIVMFQFATQVVISRNYVLGLIFITPVALVNSTINSVNAGVTVRERITDTIYGALIALVVFWIEEWINNRLTKQN